MLFVAGPHPDFIKFIQVICWIILPVLLSAIIVALYLDYRRKKKKPLEEKEEDDLEQAFPQQLGYTNGNGEYVLFDHSDLMQQYRRKLSYSHARYSALQRDLDAMDVKYATLATYAQTHFLTLKKSPMKDAHDLLPDNLQAEINKIAEREAMERRSLLEKLSQLERTYLRMEDENRILKQQISLESASEDDRTTIIAQWKEENAALKDKIEHQEYLEDIVEEKKAQVNFLQNQLEQRIRNLYQSEHQRLQNASEMRQLKEDKENLGRELVALKSTLIAKEEQIDITQNTVTEKEKQLTEKQHLLNERAEHITQLENMLREQREQTKQLNNVAAEGQEQLNSLQQLLSEAQSKIQFLTQKLFSAYIDGSREEISFGSTPSQYNTKNEDVIME